MSDAARAEPHALPRGDLRGALGRHADLLLALAVVATIALMIVPLPTALVDVLVTANIAAAVCLMLVAIYVAEPLKIATFPTLLLLTTLFRVAIEVAATRLILLQADAGHVIDAFGRFVVSGNLVVGVVIFLILTLVQFVVVAKGAERVAEVGARFTLDAMPGKQLAIDAELRAGHIDREEAQRRRRRLGREAQFFGAMDGAMKFVKGDAIAGLLILLVNIVGGMVIGVFQRKLGVNEAARTYTILTIGEGLVAQIPALVISTAAGVLVTRVSAEDEGGALGSEIGRQVLAQPKALAFAAGLLAVMAVVPGLPALPFLLLAAGLGFVAQRLLREERRAAPSAVAPADTTSLPSPVTIEFGRELRDELAAEASGLGADIAAARERLFARRGIHLDDVPLRESAELAPRDFRVRLHDVPVMQGSCPVDSVLALSEMQRLTARDWPAVPARLPNGRSGAWVPAGAAQALEQAGTACLTAGKVVAAHLDSALDTYAHELLGVQETQGLLDTLGRSTPALVSETVPKLLSVAALTELLRRLAEERVSLRHLRAVLESVATSPPEQRTPEALTERARQALRRALTNTHASPAGQVSVYVLDPMIEETLREGALRGGRSGAFDPELMRDVQAGARRAFGNDTQPVVLTQARIRRAVWQLLSSEFPGITVLSYDELLPEATVETLGRIAPA